MTRVELHLLSAAFCMVLAIVITAYGRSLTEGLWFCQAVLDGWVFWLLAGFFGALSISFFRKAINDN